jgi:Antimicrobial peptide resistance and lipid A acylation protein PagP
MNTHTTPNRFDALSGLASFCISLRCSPAVTAGSLVLALGSPTSAHAAEPEWRLQVGGLSHHFEPTRAAGRKWQEQHPGLGLERLVRDDRWSIHSTGGIVQDSRGFWGGYAGTAYLRNWKVPGNVELAAGAGLYAFYRSSSWNGKMTLVPGVLPTASIFLPASNMGVNFIYVPQIGAYNKTMPAVLHAQLSYKFR